MPIDPDALMNYVFPDIRHDYVERDAILYALGIGLGADPLDQQQLDFLLETRLRVLPTFAVTLASPGMWIRDPALGVDFTNVVHAAQHASFAKPLPPHGSVVGRARIAALADRGAGRGARLLVERSISDAEDGSLYCTLCQELLLRGDGGFGGEAAPKPADRQRPDRRADFRRASAFRRAPLSSTASAATGTRCMPIPRLRIAPALRGRSCMVTQPMACRAGH